jgi:hypothetical protein
MFNSKHCEEAFVADRERQYSPPEEREGGRIERIIYPSDPEYPRMTYVDWSSK